MLVEKGDYFVITRGIALNMDGFSFMGMEVKRASDKPMYDRSWDGILFKAEEVAGDAVAARMVAMNPDMVTQWRQPGMVRIVNLSEVETMTVTQAFAEMWF